MSGCIRDTWEEMHTEFWCANLSERGHLQCPSLDQIIVLKWILSNRKCLR